MRCGAMKGKEGEQTGCGMLRVWGVNLVGGGMGEVRWFVYEFKKMMCCDAMKDKRDEQTECGMLRMWEVNLVGGGKR